jgi:hypothetical protein
MDMIFVVDTWAARAIVGADKRNECVSNHAASRPYTVPLVLLQTVCPYTTNTLTVRLLEMGLNQSAANVERTNIPDAQKLLTDRKHL